MAEWNSTDGPQPEEAGLQHNLWNRVDGASTDFTPPRKKRARFDRKSKVWKAVGAAVVLILLVACAIAIVVELKVKRGRNNDHKTSLISECAETLYPTVCVDSLSPLTNGPANSKDMVNFSIVAATAAVVRDLTTAQVLFVSSSTNNNPRLTTGALLDCVTFLQDSLDSLTRSANQLPSLSAVDPDGDVVEDLQTWMSAALTTQETCLDEINEFIGPTAMSNPFAEFVKDGNYTSMLLSNVIAFVAVLRRSADDIPLPPGNRRLLTLGETITTVSQRRLLQSSTFIPDMVVAKDGSGNYSRIQDAINKCPLIGVNSNTTYVIYIKSGTYLETVVVPKALNYLVIVGDGVGKTIISGNLSVVESNVTTAATATMTVLGHNFVGRDFTVLNTAGAENQQAVAIRVAGDFSAFERCEFLAYQDTMYSFTNRQYYQNCTIQGTIDFIFGNAAAVFQNSLILATEGLLGYQNTFTASGRNDPNQNTGLSFQGCTFDGTASLLNVTNNGTYQTFLGRPWKPYARTVVFQSTLSSVVDPAGWLAWNDVAPNSSCVYYGEYLNMGPGSPTLHRVAWSKQMSADAALKFTADAFIDGQSWLPATNIEGAEPPS